MSQYHSAILGFVVGDALGVPVEFLDRDTFQVSDMQSFGSWKVPAGSWSDDSSMMFCTMANLVEDAPLSALKKKFCDWAFRGYWTYNNGQAFDIGEATSKVIQQWEYDDFNAPGLADEYSNGNGSLMRILPIAIWIHQHQKIEEVFSLCKDYSSLTHAHMRSVLSCTFYVHVVLELLDGQSVEAGISVAREHLVDYLKDAPSEAGYFERILQPDFASLKRDNIRSSGYVIDTLEAVFWCIQNSHSYEEAVLLGIHLGQDTDTIGALIGGLAGILYGEEAIPKSWIKVVARLDDINKLIKAFTG